MTYFPRVGGALRTVAAATLCLAATTAWPAAATAQVFGTTTERVSVASDGTEGNRQSQHGAVSADGRYVVFDSYATNLVADDVKGSKNVFIHDRITGETALVSVGIDGSPANGGGAKISADGTLVAFVSSATNLVSGDTNGTYDVFVRDLTSGITTRVSVSSGGTQANGHSGFHAIAFSANGRYIAFQSGATNLVANDNNGSDDIFVHDLITGITERVNISTSGAQANGSSSGPAISADSSGPAISADGRYVAFYSGAWNLVDNDTNNSFDVFVRDREQGTTERVSIANDGSQADSYSSDPVISADGQQVAFASLAYNLVDIDDFWGYDVFVRDRQAQTTELVSVASNGDPGNSSSHNPVISADGRFVAFVSSASNFVSGEAGPYPPDVFVHDRLTGSKKIVSVSVDGSPARIGDASYPYSMTADGQLIVFASWATNIIPNDTNGTLDVFVRYSAPTGPSAPTAQADGPYAYCANVGLALDGTKSSNPDEGVSEEGFPGDTIPAYDWDLNDDGAFDDADGEGPDVTDVFEMAAPGVYPIALKVTDTTAASYPSSGLGDLSDEDASEVTVYDPIGPSCACVGSLSARVKSRMVQVSWNDAGAPGYRVYRATPPGNAFTVVATLPAGTHLFVDQSVVNGISYAYQVVTIAENGAETCPSGTVIATPRGR